jgi:hypothetical protein
MEDHFGLELNSKIENSGARKVFTPHAPVKIQELLFGRSEAVKKIINQIHTPGAYPVLFGDRGVGKTSIASIINSLIRFGASFNFVEMKRCSSKETLSTIFFEPLKKCGVDTTIVEITNSSESSGGADVSAFFAKGGVGSKRGQTEKRGSVEKSLTSSVVAELLSTKIGRGLFIVDETDAIADESVKYQLAEIVKLLSDSHSTFKIMLVGVADLSSSLTAGHPSIGRCAVESKIDRMADAEIQQIISVGGKRIKPPMDFDNDVIKHIAQLSSGYPYFAHLIALKCVEDALKENRKFIRMHHLPEALRSAALEAEQSLRGAFETATSSPTSNMYRIVINSAASFGSENFSAADLRKKISQESDHLVNQAALNNLFKKLVGDNHLKILHRVAKGTYRFSDPRMPSFVKMVCESERHYPNK